MVKTSIHLEQSSHESWTIYEVCINTSLTWIRLKLCTGISESMIQYEVKMYYRIRVRITIIQIVQ